MFQVCAMFFSLWLLTLVSLYYNYVKINSFSNSTFKIMRMKQNDKEVSTSGWFGLEHHKEIHTIDFYRHIGIETLCSLYPEIFKPEIWLSKNPPKIGLPKKKLVKRSK